MSCCASRTRAGQGQKRLDGKSCWEYPLTDVRVCVYSVWVACPGRFSALCLALRAAEASPAARCTRSPQIRTCCHLYVPLHPCLLSFDSAMLAAVIGKQPRKKASATASQQQQQQQELVTEACPESEFGLNPGAASTGAFWQWAAQGWCGCGGSALHSTVHPGALMQPGVQGAGAGIPAAVKGVALGALQASMPTPPTRWESVHAHVICNAQYV